jgi:membrane protein YdbS with pleckstrin-like domain
MRHPLTLNWKLAAAVGVSLPLVMVLLRLLWPDIAWGFLLLFGLQVMLLLAALHLVITSIWGPGSRWNLPNPAVDSQRRIFVKKGAFMANLRATMVHVKDTAQAPLKRFFKRKTS